MLRTKIEDIFFFSKTGIFSRTSCLVLPLRYNRGEYNPPVKALNTFCWLLAQAHPLYSVYFFELQQFTKEEVSLRREIFKSHPCLEKKKKKQPRKNKQRKTT